MRRTSVLFLILFTGCTLGDVSGPDTGEADPTTETPPPGQQELELVDGDGDGVPDGFDLDGDGIPDLGLDALCAEPFLDGDGDGVPEGLDFDCDGVSDFDLPAVDVPLDPPDCIPGLVDDDGDGVPDGIDLDCDGASDFAF